MLTCEPKQPYRTRADLPKALNTWTCKLSKSPDEQQLASDLCAAFLRSPAIGQKSVPYIRSGAHSHTSNHGQPQGTGTV